MVLIAQFKRCVYALCAVLLCGYTPISHSATIEGLYDTAVAVVGQDAIERRRGFRLALESVLVKLTGDGAIATLPELSALMSNAQLHVEQYRYLPFADASTSTGENANVPATSSGPTHLLEVSFAQASLNRALNELGLPLWGAERPETLTWLAVQERNQRYILAGGANNAVRQALDKVALKRALPILLPIMDLKDQSAVNFSDVRGGFTGPVQDASRRYGVDTVLTGSLSQGNSGWRAQWVLYRNSRIYRWKAEGESVTDVITVGMEGLANQLARTFSIAVNYSQSSSIQLRVDQVGSLDDYARVLAYLSGLAVVEKSVLIALLRMSVTFA